MFWWQSNINLPQCCSKFVVFACALFWLEFQIVLWSSGLILVCNKYLALSLFLLQRITFLDDLRQCPIEAVLDDKSLKYFNISDFGKISANGSIDVQFYFECDAEEFCAVLTTKASVRDTLHSHVVCEYIFFYLRILRSILCVYLFNGRFKGFSTLLYLAISINRIGSITRSKKQHSPLKNNCKRRLVPTTTFSLFIRSQFRSWPQFWK